MKKALYIVITLAAIALPIGISVSPGTFLIQDVPLGKTLDITGTVGYKLQVGGVANRTEFTIVPKKPSADGTKATGYYDFPEPDWFKTGALKIIAKSDSFGSTNMWVTLPNDPALYNRHFLLGIDVSPTVETTKGMLAVGAYLLFRFETPAAENVVPSLEKNEMVFVPSIVDFKAYKAGEAQSKNLKLYSSEKSKQVFKLYRLDPESDVAKLTILVSPGYQRAPEGSVFFPEKITLENGVGKLFVQAAFASVLPYPRVEELIIAESPLGNKAFVRVKITNE
jgi:hypothetical protein